jgi:hypothetical protein
MASFPNAIATFRTMVNRAGVVYDALKTKVIYAEDFNNERDEIIAIETLLKTGGGWYPVAVPTLQSSDDPTYVLRFASDMTATLAVGQRIKLTQHSAVKYFIITVVGAYTGGNTDVTVYGGTDYDMEDTGTYPVTVPYFSMEKAPVGFPLDPLKWSIVTTDYTERSQATPSAGTWYNLNGTNIVVPIGAWKITYMCAMGCDRASAGAIYTWAVLSVNNNDGGTQDFQTTVSVYNMNFGEVSVFCEAFKKFTTKTTLYLNNQAQLSSMLNLWRKTVVIRAVCAYL